VFQTAFDYLYLDLDGDQQRSFGVAAGYDERSPGYGEPMFMPDDANGDGVLGPDERVLLLGTSQIRAINNLGVIYTRGVDLISTPFLFTAQSFHGTSTAGIITGGQTHPFRANRAHVPGAEIALVTLSDLAVKTEDDEFVELMAWLVEDMDAVVVNHSWGSRADREHQDGSALIDAAIDAASAEGAVQVCSAGNARQTEKHRMLTTEAGVAVFQVSVPSFIFGAAPTRITFDLHWSEPEAAFACIITRPDGATHVVEEIPDGAFEGLLVDAVRMDSERGWAMLSINVSNPADEHVGVGAWSFACTHDGPDDFVAHARISDNLSTGEVGADFIDATQTSTQVSPAIADTCITVGGYPIQYDGSPFNLATYSSFGPRYDGFATTDVAAPVDAVTATIENLAGGGDNGSYNAFSGTSGAAPQVAAASALMRVLDPSLTPADVLARIQEGGLVDEDVDIDEVPDVGWGYGKLRAAQGFTGRDTPPRPEVQTIELEVEYTYDEGDCAATISVAGVDWPDASFRWDVEYDGHWDTPFEVASTRTISRTPDAGAFHVRVDAGQRGFIVAGATLVGEAPADCFVEPAADETGADETGSTGGPLPGDGSSGPTDATGDTDPSSDGEAGGCGCRSSATKMPAWMLMVFAAHRRRRR
jgi:MYXO-CTERM domain-containing protein